MPYIDSSVAPSTPPAAVAAAKKSMLREALELAACTAAIYLCFLGYGYLHEMMSPAHSHTHPRTVRLTTKQRLT